MFTAGGSGGYVAEKAETAAGWLFPVGDEVSELGYVDMFSDMFDAIDDGTAPRETFYDGYVVNSIMDAAYRSAKSHAWEPVTLDWRGGTTPRITLDPRGRTRATWSSSASCCRTAATSSSSRTRSRATSATAWYPRARWTAGMPRTTRGTEGRRSRHLPATVRTLAFPIDCAPCVRVPVRANSHRRASEGGGEDDHHDHGLAPRARHRCRRSSLGTIVARRTQRLAGPVTPTMGGSITMAVEGEPTSVDPAFDYDFVSGLATSSITEPLLVFCEHDTKLCPNLATSWTVSPDGLTYTLKIRQGVKFHDGTTMTVDDVVYSLDRIRDPKLGSYVGWMLANVADVTAPDAETVVITLSKPMRSWSTPSRPPPPTWSTRRSWRPTATSTARPASAPSAPVPSSSWSG